MPLAMPTTAHTANKCLSVRDMLSYTQNNLNPGTTYTADDIIGFGTPGSMVYTNPTFVVGGSSIFRPRSRWESASPNYTDEYTDSSQNRTVVWGDTTQFNPPVYLCAVGWREGGYPRETSFVAQFIITLKDGREYKIFEYFGTRDGEDPDSYSLRISGATENYFYEDVMLDYPDAAGYEINQILSNEGANLSFLSSEVSTITYVGTTGGTTYGNPPYAYLYFFGSNRLNVDPTYADIMDDLVTDSPIWNRVIQISSGQTLNINHIINTRDILARNFTGSTAWSSTAYTITSGHVYIGMGLYPYNRMPAEPGPGGDTYRLSFVIDPDVKTANISTHLIIDSYDEGDNRYEDGFSEGDVIQWSVSRDGYGSINSSITMPDSATTISVRLDQEGMSSQYMRFKIIQTGNTAPNNYIMWKRNPAGSWTGQTVQYGFGGEYATPSEWHSLTPSVSGDKITGLTTDGNSRYVYFKGPANAYYGYLGSDLTYCYFECGEGVKFELEGNAASMYGWTPNGGTVNNASNYLFYGMFSGCTGMTEAYNFVLPSTSVGNHAYEYMFFGCTSLKSAPVVGITNAVQQSACASMFENCTSLEVAPTLRGSSVATGGYQRMFYNCQSLKYIRITTPYNQQSNYGNWVYNVSASGTFVKPTSNIWPESADGVPNNWAIQGYQTQQIVVTNS